MAALSVYANIVPPVFALLGVCLPPLAYRSVAKRSVIERLREAEG